MENNTTYHIPVLFKESIEALQINPAGTYVDVTFGGGGHAREIFSHLNEQGKLIVLIKIQMLKKTHGKHLISILSLRISRSLKTTCDY